MFAFPHCSMLEKNACVTLSVLNPLHSDDFLRMLHYLYIMRSLSDFFSSFCFFLLTYCLSVIEIIMFCPCLLSPLKFYVAILTEVDGLLPLAAACSDSSLLDVQSSFIEACGRAAFAVLGRLQERALEVPSSASLKNLPALLSTCIYVHQRLQHYHSSLKDSNTTPAKV